MLERALDRLLDAVEVALADLDALDGDPDLEPALGAPEDPCRLFTPAAWLPRTAGDQRAWANGGDVDDREEVSEDEGGACEDEGHDSDREADYADHG